MAKRTAGEQMDSVGGREANTFGMQLKILEGMLLDKMWFFNSAPERVIYSIVCIISSVEGNQAVQKHSHSPQCQLLSWLCLWKDLISRNSIFTFFTNLHSG